MILAYATVYRDIVNGNNLIIVGKIRETAEKSAREGGECLNSLLMRVENNTYASVSNNFLVFFRSASCPFLLLSLIQWCSSEFAGVIILPWHGCGAISAEHAATCEYTSFLAAANRAKASFCFSVSLSLCSSVFRRWLLCALEVLVERILRNYSFTTRISSKNWFIGT